MKYEIQQTDDQTLRIRIETHLYLIRLHSFRGLVYADVTCDSQSVVCGARCLANRWIVPPGVSPHGDNFRFETYRPDANEYPQTTGFNDKFVFAYYAADEVEALEAADAASSADEEAV